MTLPCVRREEWGKVIEVRSLLFTRLLASFRAGRDPGTHHGLIQIQAGVSTTTNYLSQSVSCSHPAGTLLLPWLSEKGQQQALVEPNCSCSCLAVPGPALPLFACRLMPMWGIPLSSSIFWFVLQTIFWHTGVSSVLTSPSSSWVIDSEWFSCFSQLTPSMIFWQSGLRAIFVKKREVWEKYWRYFFFC